MSFHFWVFIKKTFPFRHLKWSLILDWRSMSPIFILFYLLLLFPRITFINVATLYGKEMVAQHGTSEKDTPSMQQVSNCCPLRPVLMQTARILSVPKQTKPKFSWIQIQTQLFSADFFFFSKKEKKSLHLITPGGCRPQVGLRQAAGLTVREGPGSATRVGSLWAAPARAEGSLQVL